MLIPGSFIELGTHIFDGCLSLQDISISILKTIQIENFGSLEENDFFWQKLKNIFID
jgi:hypothetical protein